MSDNRKEELLDIAAKAEQDLNSDRLKFGRQEGTGFGGKDTKGGSTSTDESGIDQSVTNKFPGSTAEYGSHTSGAGNNRDIPPSEGGDIQKGTGRMTKAGDFDQGEAGEGPEDIALRKQEELGGDDSVRGNVKNPSTGRAAGNLGVQ
ncbi:hypothetical protein LTS08_004494 [Lithohypha guttulata]|uniref:Uncharacterized protein n=1 Tax=Lithohypha guttulata TaxID=1690604 RepID=A0AAN7STZ4_9EURO|nr:hypothetical protein LTR05_008105 [Lithohypha guttulata]KAK5102034.1 hypothetical protein LTS08_004494 [Lithohypha guttulata]